MIKLIAVLCATLSLAPVWALTDVELNDVLPDMVEQSQGGVVNIQATTLVQTSPYYGGDMDNFFNDFFGMRPKTRRQTSLGSGFVIDSDGYVVTNNHVIATADEVVCMWSSGKKSFSAKARIVGRDPIVDLALLKLIKPQGQLYPLKFGDSDKLRVGQIAVAMGNPFGLSGTVTRGIISSLHRSIGAGPYDDFLQTDASINFGNSGGPLFNIKGEVIGVNTAIKAGGQGIGFAIPSNLVKTILPQLRDLGRVVRSWLGIVGENNRPIFQVQFGIPDTPGVVVYSIVSKRPAAKAGIQAGDVIGTIGGNKIDDIYDLQREVQSKSPGSVVDVEITRTTRAGTKKLKTKVKLEELPPSQNLPEGYNFM